MIDGRDIVVLAVRSPHRGGALCRMAVLAMVAVFGGVARGQQPNAAGETESKEVKPLALKETMVRDRFQRFEDRVFRLRDQLGEGEPENAARLARVLQRAGELGLADQLDKVIELLEDGATIDQAEAAQALWLENADRLLAILLDRDADNEQRKREIERLEAYNKKLAEILEQQQSLRDATAQAGMTERMREQLDQAIQRMDALLQRQGNLSEQSAKQADGAAGQKEAGEQQAALAREAAQLAEDIERLSEMKSESSADSEAQQAAREKTAEAAQSAKQGAQSMSQAGEQLQSGQGQPAGEQQAQAKESLEKARKQLEEAKRRLEEQREADALNDEQKEVTEKTQSLSQQMQKDASESESQQGGQQGGQPGGKEGGKQSTPGQQALDQAQQEMKQAQKELEASKEDQATDSQDRAIDELEQAQKELEEALNQLRKEEREETLRDLEGRFREMLSKQKTINDATLQLDGLGRENFKRAEQLQLADLADKQGTLADDAESCLHILTEDGTTIVFPRVVSQLAADMNGVADRLTELKVGALTQAIEAEIVDTLEQLLEAVEQMQQDSEQEDSSQQSAQSGESPLLPGSAELKLLRASQLRINTRTQAIESARDEGGESADSLSAALRKVAGRQIECADTAREMRDRQQQP